MMKSNSFSMPNKTSYTPNTIPPTISTMSFHNLIERYRVRGKYAEMEPLCNRATAIWEKALGKEHPKLALTFSNLAKVYAVQGNYAQAEQCHLCSLAIQKKTLELDHLEVALNLKDMAELYHRWSLATLLRTTRQVSGETDSLVSPATRWYQP